VSRRRCQCWVRRVGHVALVATLLSCGRSPTKGSKRTKPSTRAAELVLRNGRVVTLDPKLPEAQALAVRGDVIVAVGSNSEIQRHVGPSTRVIDLKGRLTIPGFIEGHAHFLGLGQAKLRLQLGAAKSFVDLVALVKDAARKARPGEWILGRGWHQEKWSDAATLVKGLPTHHALSRVAPKHPVLLSHASGHAVLANRRAMELAGITRATPDPPGGTIVRDGKGEPTGVFRENASGLLSRALAKSRAGWKAYQVEGEWRRAVSLATRECWSRGITSFQDAGASFQLIDFYRQLAGERALGVRLWVMIGEDNAALSRKLAGYRLVGLGDRRLTVRAIKRYVDGALGSHGAWLLAPYADLPKSSGLNATPLPVLRRTAELAAKHGFQLCTHAIGDRGNREVLDLYEKVLRLHPGKVGRRWRIEHAQHLHPKDIPRFARLGVIAAMQSIHCTSDGPWVVKRLGVKRSREGAYAWRSLIRAGAVVSNGSDAPVESVDPIAGFHAAVTRRMANGKSFFGEQRMTRLEALRSYTVNAAYAAFEERFKGSLAPGKLADIVVLSRDILRVDTSEIRKARVVYTILGGRIVYKGGS